MKVTDAVALIKAGIGDRLHAATWADLGCGSGIFTNALATLLPVDSKIYAVDKENQELKIPEIDRIKIEFVKLDFLEESLPFFTLDGIMIANALHYVKDKSWFVEKLKKHLKGTGQLVIVEYDTERQNRWVPYPINFDKLTQIFSAGGFRYIKKIGERNSVYRSEKMYACAIRYR